MTGTLSQPQAIALFARLEATAPVAEWSYRDLRIWPLARFALRRTLVSDLPTPPGEQIIRRSPRYPLAGLSRYLASGARAALGSLWAARAAAIGGRNRAVTLGDGVSTVRLGDAVWDRFCDPIADLYAESGLTSLALERRARPAAGRRRPAVDIAPIAALALHVADALVRDARAAVLPGRAALLDILADRPAACAVLDPLRLARAARAVLIAAALLKPIFVRTRARHVFVVDFYNTAGFAAILAARAAGAIAVDVQHGVIDTLNDAYAGWTRVPPGGYALLPELYWTWTAQDAAAIEAWSHACAPAHRARPLGNPYLWLWRADGPGARVTSGAPIFPSPAEKDILVTLQPLARFADYYALLARVIVKAPPSWRWMIRRHPTAAPEPGNPLEALTAPNLDRERANALPLPVLLRHADVHVTAGSSATLEAAALGVPTIIGLPDTHAEYGQLHGSPLLTLAQDEVALLAALRALPPRAARREVLPDRDAAKLELGL